MNVPNTKTRGAVFADNVGIVAVVLVLGLCGCMQGPLLPGSDQTKAASEETAVPAGVVVAFAGEVIPDGWTLCDGQNTPAGARTPDLRDRFVLGTSPEMRNVGEIGGEESHTHSAEVGQLQRGRAGVDSDNDIFVASSAHTHPISVHDAAHLPPHVKLVYIMKD